MTRYFDTTITVPPGSLREIVRGKEQYLIEIMEPVVRMQPGSPHSFRSTAPPMLPGTNSQL